MEQPPWPRLALYRGSAPEVPLPRRLLPSGAPGFSFKLEGEQCLAMVEIKVLGVLHTFSGQLCDDSHMAEADVARRVLWYLRAPGCEDAFEPDEDYAKKAAQLIPGPPTADWVKDGAWEDKRAERKTKIML